MFNVTPRLMAYNVREPLGGNGGSRVDRFIAAAMKFEGQPYHWGGGHVGSTFSKPGPVDCSGLVMQAARMAGFNLDGTAATQQDKGRSVGMNELQKGDLLFHGNPASHVGIYIGNGKAIHASSTQDRIMVVDLDSYDYFDSARRIFDAGDRADASKPEPKPQVAEAPRPRPAHHRADRFEASPALQASAQAPQPGPSYVPQPAETLLTIAERTLGDRERWMEIYQLNRHVMPTPYVLFPGQPITLPAGAKVDAPAAAPVAVAAAPATAAVGAFQNVQAFLGGTKDKLAQVMAGMAMG